MTQRTIHMWVPTLMLLALTGCPVMTPSMGGGTMPTAAVLAKEIEAHDLVNAERIQAGRAALTMREDLRVVARAHSEDMAARGFFEHENPDGLDPFERMANANITFNTAGENIHANQGFADPAAIAVTGWMNSSGHRANILNGGFTHTGMGVAITPSNKYYFTQVFIGTSKEVPEGYVDVFYYGPIDANAEIE